MNYFEEVDEMVDSVMMAALPSFRSDVKWQAPITCKEPLQIAFSDEIVLYSSYKAFREGLEEKRRGSEEVDGRGNTAAGGAADYRAAVGQAISTASAKRSAPYATALQGTIYGWRLVATGNRRVGIVPNSAQAGDVVAIFKGGLVPFILRRSQERPGTFRPVGECYMHGIMHGEALAGTSLSHEEFRLHQESLPDMTVRSGWSMRWCEGIMAGRAEVWRSRVLVSAAKSYVACL